MLKRDSHPVDPAATAGRVAVLATLAVIFQLSGDRLAGLETGFYDLLQRWTANAAPDRVVVIDTGSAGSLWSARDLPDLINRLHGLGAALILPAEPLPAPVRESDLARLRTLIAIEERGTRSARLPDLSAQLAALEAQQAAEGRIAASMTSAGNVVVGLPLSGAREDGDPAIDTCEKRVIALAPLYPLPADANPGGTQVGPVSGPLCAAAAAVGHLIFPTDADGIARRQRLVIGTGPGPVPAAGLAALSVAARDGAMPGTAPSLLRYYVGAGTGSFTQLRAADAMNSSAGALQGRLVVIGNSTVASDGVRTPMAVTNGMALMVATSLANLLDGSGIRRPALLPWLELPLALLLSAAAVMAFRRLVPVAGILLGLGVGAALLLIEFGLFNGAGVWVKLASLAVFCPVAFAMLQVLERLPPAGRSVSERGAADAPGSGAQHGAELDLAFSYLRQQPVTDLTKQRLYELAMDHGRRRDYARAERVFRHLASRDPDYRDVADKLEKLSGARGQLQVPPVPESANAQAVPAADKDAQRTLGRYELERVLGRGAMATVYLGRDPTINRRVAIKTVMLATEFADSELATARATFRREAESSGRLNHPNIISIYDAGESNNVAYLAMEYFDGKPLSDFAQPGCLLPPRQVLDLMARAADALHYAHNQHVVHRDIKPGNLMYHPQTDTLKLTDFGIARLTDASRTRTGIVLGTPSYMSPEQLAGSKVTGLSDLYSLAVTMYHLLAGSPPFQADSIAKLMDKIAREPHRPVREIRDDLPACVDAVLDRALAKNPSDRYPSGHAMAFAIRECCNSVRANE